MPFHAHLYMLGVFGGVRRWSASSSTPDEQVDSEFHILLMLSMILVASQIRILHEVRLRTSLTLLRWTGTFLNYETAERALLDELDL